MKFLFCTAYCKEQIGKIEKRPNIVRGKYKDLKKHKSYLFKYCKKLIKKTFPSFLVPDIVRG